MPFEREDPRPHRIGFISTRFAGTDGVRMEPSKWVAALRAIGVQILLVCQRNWIGTAAP